MKKTIIWLTFAAMLLPLLSIAPFAAAQGSDIEQAAAALAEKYVDSAFWTSDGWNEQLRHNPSYTSPTDEDIAQTEAVLYAVNLLVELGYETLTSVAQCDPLTFAFRLDDFGNREWWLYFGMPASDKVNAYMIAADAETGAITNFIVGIETPVTSPVILQPSGAQQDEIDLLIQTWKTELAGTSRWELDERLPFQPPEGAIPREEALRNGLAVLMKMRGTEPAVLGLYSMGFGFSANNEWVITLMPEGASIDFERVYVLVDAHSGMVVNVEYRRVPPVDPNAPEDMVPKG